MRRVVIGLCLVLGCNDVAEGTSGGADGSGDATQGEPQPEPGPDPDPNPEPDPEPNPEPDPDPSPEPEPEVTGPFPIVLAHGFFGFEDFAGAGFVDYFWDVRADLATQGETEVFTPAVDPFNDSTIRGQQLLAAVEQVIADTGKPKVNLIGHSQGGLDARVVAAMRPDLVASVTTFATPHLGTSIADTALDLVPGDTAAGLLDAVVQLFGSALWGSLTDETSLSKALVQLSVQGMVEFNEQYPDQPTVQYFSITGRSDRHPGGPACTPDVDVPFVAATAKDLDPVDTLFAVTEGMLSPDANDGLVREVDARWGVFLGCVAADHADEIGHLFGDSPGGNNSFDHFAFYRGLVAFLREQQL